MVHRSIAARAWRPGFCFAPSEGRGARQVSDVCEIAELACLGMVLLALGLDLWFWHQKRSPR